MPLTLEEKAAWTARLRSGEFTKIKGKLSDDCGGRCVLGVLCEVVGIGVGDDKEPYGALKSLGVGIWHFIDKNDDGDLSFEQLADHIDALVLSDHRINLAPLPPLSADR